MNTIRNIKECQFFQPLIENRSIRSDIVLIALGIIFTIGGAVAAGALYSSLGPSSLKCLASTAVGLALIGIGIHLHKKSEGFKHKVSHIPVSSIDYERPDNKIIVKIGSPTHRLDEKGIQESLQINSILRRENIDALVIFGHGSVEINDDPGIVALNPKKLILVGAKIIHGPSHGFGSRLDDQLFRTNEWHSTSHRGDRKNTYLHQIEVNTVEEAIAATPPVAERPRAVYLVKES